ncbi:VanZ family protein [Paenibacillus tuaregi]|uniref:VanZ family protein n=1 Tax=Paenibacillus tuaregi TaxID=1816681 RepID=UPI000838E29F|nr:VanZ family protein [Paenibacillus tuaregi]
MSDLDIRFTIGPFPALILLFGVLLAVLLLKYRFSAANLKSWRQLLFSTCLSLYLTGAAYFVFFPIDVNIGRYASQNPWYSSINWIPVLTIDIKSFVLNIILFIPFGVLAPLAAGRLGSWRGMVKASLLLSLSIEVIQFIVGQALGSYRSTDINDLLANTLGGGAGYMVLFLVVKNTSFRRLLFRKDSSMNS